MSSVMSIRIARIAVLAALSLAGAVGVASAQTAPPAPPANARSVPYVHGHGRHDEYAHSAASRQARSRRQGGELAARQLCARRAAPGFAGIVKAVPKFRGMPVGDLVDLALTQPLNAVEAAIKQQDAQKFCRRLRSAQPGLQCLPHGARSPLCGDQNARCVGVSEPGIQAAAVSDSPGPARSAGPMTGSRNPGLNCRSSRVSLRSPRATS